MVAIFYGFNPPFIGGPQGIMSRQEDEKLIKNDILLLLLTVPGERIMDPNFGVNLRSALFEKIDDSIISSLESEILDKLLFYDTRVIPVDIAVSRNENTNTLNVRVVVKLKIDPFKEIVIEQIIRGG